MNEYMILTEEDKEKLWVIYTWLPFGVSNINVEIAKILEDKFVSTKYYNWIIDVFYKTALNEKKTRIQSSKN